MNGRYGRMKHWTGISVYRIRKFLKTILSVRLCSQKLRLLTQLGSKSYCDYISENIRFVQNSPKSYKVPKRNFKIRYFIIEVILLFLYTQYVVLIKLYGCIPLTISW